MEITAIPLTASDLQGRINFALSHDSFPNIAGVNAIIVESKAILSGELERVGITSVEDNSQQYHIIRSMIVDCALSTLFAFRDNGTEIATALTRRWQETLNTLRETPKAIDNGSTTGGGLYTVVSGSNSTYGPAASYARRMPGV